MLYTKPCIVCGKQLLRCGQEVGYENQPDDGLIFRSEGNYGSTAFDPFDGTYIEVIICDDCVVAAGTANKILTSKAWRDVVCSVYVDGRLIRLIVGRERLDRPMVDWHQGLSGYGADDVVLIEPEEAGTDLGSRVEWWDETVKWAHEHSNDA